MRVRRQRPDGTTGTLAALIASRYWRAADAERVLEAWRRSGQSVAAFARQHGVSKVRVLRWRDRLKPPARPVFHPVRVVQGARPLAPATPVALELELHGGRRIRVYAGFDPAVLEALVRTIEGWGC